MSMSASRTLREALVSTRSQPVFAMVTALVVCTVLVIILSTTGRSAAAEQLVLSRLDNAGSRVIQITATTPKPTLDTTMLKVASGLSDVEWALGFSQPQDGIEHAVGAGG